MRVTFNHDRALLFHGDSGELELPESSIDALVCDPPAGIGFMAKDWDKDRGGRAKWIEWLAKTLAPAYRALKPGAHGLVWALPRSTHWTALALEEAGFEIRDRVSHWFGTGFPKSLTSKSAPIPDECGTALKPAHEDWWLVRKPLDGSVGENYARWGTGTLWIDRCRIGDENTQRPTGREPVNGWGMARGVVAGSTGGRWPAHLVLSHGDDCEEGACVDDCPVRMLDEQSGESKSSSSVGVQRFGRSGGIMGNVGALRDGRPEGYRDSGGASRFFYVAKGSRSEKDEGLDHLPIKSGGEATGRTDGSAGVANPRAGAGRTGGARNFHPTVKSIGLMRWLVRLVTPPGGTVLDTFAGSGSTGVAAIREGFNFVGCELTDDYLPILEGRVRHALARPAQ